MEAQAEVQEVVTVETVVHTEVEAELVVALWKVLRQEMAEHMEEAAERQNLGMLTQRYLFLAQEEPMVVTVEIMANLVKTGAHF